MERLHDPKSFFTLIDSDERGLAGIIAGGPDIEPRIIQCIMKELDTDSGVKITMEDVEYGYVFAVKADYTQDGEEYARDFTLTFAPLY